MNLILTRTKDEHLSLCWEPFATSTPLKAISNNANINGSQKQLLLNINSPDFVGKLQKSCNISHGFQKKNVQSKHLVSKKPVKKKSSIFFDLSSSDEDSTGDNKKRPIIKLHSGRKTKSILFSKKQIDDKIKVVEKSNKSKLDNCKKIENIKHKNCEKNSVVNLKSLKSEIHHQNVAIHDALNLGLNSKKNSISSDEESKIFDETDKVKNSENDKLHSEKKESELNGSLNIKSLKDLNVFNETQIRILREKPTSNQISTKPISQNINNDLHSITSPLKVTSKNKKLFISHKRKVKDLVNTTGPVKKSRIKKSNSKLGTELVDIVENAEKSLNPYEKGNMTHQLFSNIREQEFINTLDLTSEEVNEPGESTEHFVSQNEKRVPYKSLISPHPSNQSSFSCTENADKPKRKQQSCKKFLLPKNHTNDHLLSDHAKKQMKPERSLQVKAKNNNQSQEPQLSAKSELGSSLEGTDKENYKKQYLKNAKAKGNKGQKKKTKKVRNVLKKHKTSTISDDLTNKNMNDELGNMEANISLNSVASAVEFNKTSELKKPSVLKEDKKGVNKKRPVFNLLHELSFEENKMGCSVVQCWNVNTFKCGIFKLKVKSQMTCKTLHNNSCLGGVLVKGKLKMKIDDKELDLKEGDMAFVPPLTEWQATNIGKCESIFYYWCGRFNA